MTPENKNFDMYESYNKASQYWMNMYNSWAKMAASFPQVDSEENAEKNKQGGIDIFEFYTRSSKYWQDIFSTWANTVGNTTQPFGGAGPDSWMKQPFGNFDNWAKLYSGFTGMFKSMPFTLTSVKDGNEAVAKGMDLYVKIYNTWLKGIDSVVREGYGISEKISLGEEVDVANYFDTMKATYNDVTVSLVDLLKDTPFGGLKGLDKVIVDALNSIPEDQTQAREFLQEMLNFSTNMTNLSSEMMKEVNKTSAEMLANGTISGEGFKKLINKYGETLKKSVEILREKAALLPGYKGMADEATNWAKANLDLSISWLEMDLKLYQGIDKSFKDISNTAQELFKGESISSAEELQKRWGDAYQKSFDILVNEAQFSDNIHNLMSKYTDWMKSTNELYRNMMTPPYVAKDDFDRVFKDLEKVKRSVKKQAGTKAQAEEK